MSEYILEFRNIVKYAYEIGDKAKIISDTKILDGINFNLVQGEVHALVGENGAGKSTLMKILGGILPYDDGEMYVQGELVKFTNPRESRAHGIAFVHQELNLCTNLDVAHNIFLGREIRTKAGTMDAKEMYQKSQELIDSLGFNISPATILRRLSTAQQQVVEIAKALLYESRILILDEPTASLTSQEVTMLFGLIKDLKAKGVSIVYISHRLDEIEHLADRITVLRDGQNAGFMDISEFTVDKTVRMMAGRSLQQFYSCNHRPGTEKVFEIKGLKIGKDTPPVNITVNKGEIVGVGGLVGSGRTELAKSVFGARADYGGQVFLHGKELKRPKPFKSVAHRIAYLSEDRKQEGLVIKTNIRENVVMACLRKLFKGKLISTATETKVAKSMVEQFKVVCESVEQGVGTLSGGNQQRVCFAKWYATEPEVLILDEPTRGIDVNAKAQIYQVIDQAAENGMAILMISSEMPELIGMSDRVYIMRNGGVVAEIKDREDMHQEKILEYTIGVK